MTDLQLSHSLADAFNALADEAQSLADRRTVLEHKLRFAHEQFQYLADKYAPAAPEIADTLAKLQLPPHTSVDESQTVPLPDRSAPRSQHQVALVIRDGRRLANQLIALREASKTTDSDAPSFMHTTDGESMSTLEQDFTVEGKRGSLECPFSKDIQNQSSQIGNGTEHHNAVQDLVSHDPSDPMCAALNEEEGSQSAVANGATGGKCPIRFLDKHTPAEIAHYVETHKHELPRSHEICLRRYQRNDEQIRKLDSKYGNVVSMIEGLGHLHQPMLPENTDGGHQQDDDEGNSKDRVENWAHAVSATNETHPLEDVSHGDIEEGADDRESRFDRPLKEVRVGESPSRPWGISVPIYDRQDHEQGAPFSPPPAPVRIPETLLPPQTPAKAGASKCPFDHTKLASMAEQPALGSPLKAQPKTPTHPPAPPAQEKPHTHQQPTFINPALGMATDEKPPQMVFTGPVFIGYPMEQAMQFLNQYRAPQ